MPACDFARLVNPVDDLVFTVRLMKAELESELSGELAAIGLDIGKRFVAVDVRLALAEQIQVGAVQHVDDAAHGWLRRSGVFDVRLAAITVSGATDLCFDQLDLDFSQHLRQRGHGGNSDQPDEMKWARTPGGTSGWREASSTTTSDTRSL